MTGLGSVCTVGSGAVGRRHAACAIGFVGFPPSFGQRLSVSALEDITALELALCSGGDREAFRREGRNLALMLSPYLLSQGEPGRVRAVFVPKAMITPAI